MEQIQRIALEVLENPKIKNSKPETSLVERYVRRCILQVKAHCNRDDLPEALEDVVAQIAEDMMIADGYGILEKDVSSISRGDTSISYRDPKSAYMNATNFMKDYNCQLMHFRKMKLPSDPRDKPRS